MAWTPDNNKKSKSQHGGQCSIRTNTKKTSWWRVKHRQDTQRYSPKAKKQGLYSRAIHNLTEEILREFRKPTVKNDFLNSFFWLTIGHGKTAASSSIPSKYQTIVTDNSEKKGFLSRSRRFNEDSLVSLLHVAWIFIVQSLLSIDNMRIILSVLWLFCALSLTSVCFRFLTNCQKEVGKRLVKARYAYFVLDR